MVGPAMLVLLGLPLVPRWRDRLRLAALLVLGAAVALTVPLGWVDVGSLVPLREGFEFQVLTAVFHPPLSLPELFVLRGDLPPYDLRHAVIEHAVLLGLTLIVLGAWLGLRSELGVAAGVLCAALLAGVGGWQVPTLLRSESEGSRVAAATCLLALAWLWSGHAGLARRLVGLAGAGVAAAWGVGGRPEVAAWFGAGAVLVGVNALVPAVRGRADAWWSTVLSRLGPVAPVLTLGTATLLGAVVAWVAATLAGDDAPFLEPIRRLDGWLSAANGWWVMTHPRLGEITGWCLIPLGLLGWTGRLPGLVMAAVLLGTGRVVWVAGHAGEAPFEELRYLLVLWGPLALAAVEGAAVVLRAAHAAELPRGMQVLLFVAGASLQVTERGAIHTTQQQGARFALQAVVDRPACTFLTRVVDTSAPPPPADGFQPEAYLWTWARFGRPVPVPVLVDDAAITPSPSACELVYVGLDCNLVGDRPCDRVLPPGRQESVWSGESVPFNHHAGSWTPAVTFEVRSSGP